jgi:TolA-binding protein
MCDVTHRPGRTFTVLASGIEVRVVGTRFSVESEPGPGKQRVQVFVERGIVEVKTSDPERGVVRLGPGQSFAQVTEHGAAVEQPAPAVPAPSVAAAPNVPPERRTSVAETPDALARELLEEANAFRRSGDAQRAAGAYDELLRRFPNDGRAGLAAFELGRLRMDRLGDMSGAARALERAVVLAPGSGFREDAMARLVTAYAALGDSAGCSRARGRYLSSFPEGVHRQAVAGRCGTE